MTRSPKPGPPKKGLGSFSKFISATDLTHLGLSWYYNWTLTPKETSALDLEFVPMFWWGGHVTPRNLAKVRNSGAINVLGFNEPDLGGQSNMTVEQCLDLWPQLMTLNKRLGSPSPASPSWLERFMDGVKTRGLKVDFICVHMYPDFTDPRAVDEVEAMLRDVYKKYRLPVWFTECGAANVKAWHQPQLHKPTPEAARIFLKKLLAMLKTLPFLERYAWFADQVDGEYRYGSIFQQHTHRITRMGAIYRDA